MAEPLSILASITGVLAFSAQLTRQITTLLSEVRDAPIEIQDLKFELQNLSSLIRASHNLLTTHTLLPDDKPLEGTVAECLDRCSSAMSDIKSQLSHFWQAGSGGKSFFRAINWVIRKNEIRNSRDRLRDARAMFELAFTVLHAHLVGKNHTEILDEMTRSAQRLSQQLKSSRRTRSLQKKLQDDVQSVTTSGKHRRRLSLTATTDAELPIRRFFEQQQDDDQDKSESQSQSQSDATLVLPSDSLPTEIETETQTDTPAIAAASTPGNEVSLFQAVRAGNMPHLRALLSLGGAATNIDPRLPDGRTPLHLCAVQDDVAMAEVLLNHGADLDAQDERHRTPLKIAISSHSFETAALFLRRGSTVENDVAATPILLDTIRTGKGSKGFSGFLTALGKRLYISRGVLLVHEAVEHGDDEALAVLLESGFEVNKRDGTGIAPIHHAVLLQRLSTVDILLRHGADINIFLPPETRLWLRADIPWHQHLLPPILDVGTTPLGIAARAMLDVPMVKFLLGKGADPNLEFSDYCGILMGLCASQYNEIARILIDMGTDVNQKNRAHYTALYVATELNNYDLAAYLLDNAADVNVVCRGDRNWTPLHRAVANRNGRIARLLVQRGADLEARDADGRRPVDLVEIFGDNGMKALLER